MRSPLGFPLFPFLTFCALDFAAQAGVISTSGSILFIDAPPSGLTLPIAPNTLESNDIIRLYYFRNVPRSTDQMDFCQPGTYTSFANAPNCYLPSDFAGDLAYIYFDPAGNPDPPIVRSGSVTFGTRIVAILAGGQYGLELGPSSPDSVTFSADRRTVRVTLGEGHPLSLGGDQLVVYLDSDSVAEPGTLFCTGCALVFLAVFARRTVFHRLRS
jgi:hypothetical protein